MSGAGDAFGERLGDRPVEGLARIAGQDGRPGRGSEPRPVRVEARAGRRRRTRRRLRRRGRPGRAPGAGPRRRPGDAAHERLGGGRGATASDRRAPWPPRRVANARCVVGVGERSVGRLVGDDGQRPVRQPRREFERDDAAETHADAGRPRDTPSASRTATRSSTWTSTSSGDGSARRLPPLPRRSTAWTVEVARSRRASRARPASWPAVESVPWSRSEVDRPGADGRGRRGGRRPGRSTWRPGGVDRGRLGLGIQASPELGPAELAAGRPRQRLEPDERDRHLERGEPVAAVRGQGVVARVRRIRRGGRSPPTGRDPRSDRAARRRPRRRWPDASSRTASTSAGEMFSPPRTIRSVRRSSTVRRPSASSRPGRRSAASRRRSMAAAVAIGSPR